MSPKRWPYGTIVWDKRTRGTSLRAMVIADYGNAGRFDVIAQMVSLGGEIAKRDEDFYGIGVIFDWRMEREWWMIAP